MVVVATCLARSGLISRQCVSGQRNDGDFAKFMILLELTARCPTIHFGHVHVHQNQIGARDFGYFDSFPACTSGGHCETLSRQVAGDESLDIQVIFRDQDSRHVCSFLFSIYRISCDWSLSDTDHAQCNTRPRVSRWLCEFVFTSVHDQSTSNNRSGSA